MPAFDPEKRFATSSEPDHITDSGINVVGGSSPVRGGDVLVRR